MVLTWRTMVFAGIIGVGVVALQTTAAALIGITVLLVGIVVDLLITPSPRRIEAARTPGGKVRLGQETWADLTLHNPTERTYRLHLRDAWSPSAGAENNRDRCRLAAGESHVRRQTLTPTRRGWLSADKVTLRSFSVLGIAGRQVSFDVPAQVAITPPFLSRRHLPSRLHRLRELEGRTALMVRGMGTEFDSLREYVPGDDVRSIDWRATARAQEVMVKTWRPERDRRVVIVIDSGRLAAKRSAEGTQFDTFVEAAMLLTALAGSAGDRVDVIVADARIRTAFGPLAREKAIPRFDEEIADIFPSLYESDWQVMASEVLKRCSTQALVVFLTPLDAITIQEDVLPSLPLLKRGHQIAFASVSDPQLQDMADEVYSPAQVYRAGAAQREMLNQRALSRAMSASGVYSLTEPEEKLPPALADLYIRLKAQGKL